MSFGNDCAYLKFYKQCLKGIIQDYQISFYNEQKDLEFVMNETFTLFQQLVSTFPDVKLRARLVAKVNFFHMNNETHETEERSYHFSSYSPEEVDDPFEFFTRHMLKIGNNLTNFNHRGSNLLLKNIQHIHILLTLV